MGFSKAYVHTKIWDSSGQHWPWRGHRACEVSVAFFARGSEISKRLSVHYDPLCGPG